MFMLASFQRANAVGDRSRSGARYRQNSPRIGAPSAGARSSHPADSTRDALPEVPDPSSSLRQRKRKQHILHLKNDVLPAIQFIRHRGRNHFATPIAMPQRLPVRRIHSQ